MTKHLYCILLGKFIYQSRKLLLNNIFVQSIQYCSVRKKNIFSLPILEVRPIQYCSPALGGSSYERPRRV